MSILDIFKRTATEPQPTEEDAKDEVWVRKGNKFVKLEGNDENAEKGE